VSEPGQRSAGRAVAHVDWNLANAKAKPYRVNGHRGLQAEPTGQRTARFQRLDRDGPLARQGLIRHEPGHLRDGQPGETLHQAEPSSRQRRKSPDCEIEPSR
jgi:hypothetical protein